MVKHRGMPQSEAVRLALTSVPANAKAHIFEGNTGPLIEPPIEFIHQLLHLAAQGHGGVPEALDRGKEQYIGTYQGLRAWSGVQGVPSAPSPTSDHLAERQWARAVKEGLAEIVGLLDDVTEAAMFADMSEVKATGEFRAPNIGRRVGESGLFYSGAVNMIYGPPEEGKTLVATAIAIQEMNAGSSVLWLDLDDNGKTGTKNRLIAFGATEEQINNPSVFRFAEPKTEIEVRNLVAWSVTNKPDLVICDSLGKLMAAMQVRSDGDAEYADMNTKTMATMAAAGCGVLVIDHTTKSDRDDGYSIGTQRKKSDINGAMLRVKKISTFIPTVGGSASLVIQKDRPGGLRASTPQSAGNRKQIAAVFTVGAVSSEWEFALHKEVGSGGGAMAPKQARDDVATLRGLDPAPESVQDVKLRLAWGSGRASKALKAFRESVLMS